MSFSGNVNAGLQNLLDETLQRFFTDSEATIMNDTSLNYLREWVTAPFFEANIPLNNTNVQTQTVEEEDHDSIPDLIDPVTGRVNNGPEPESADRNRGIQLWANVLEDYNSQMRMYQENVRTILDITQNFLPTQTRNRTTTNTTTNFWRDLLRNNTYTIDIERILPNLFSNNTMNRPPTENQILSATTVFNYDISNNELSCNICPISLEEFQDGESLTRINHCRHVFRTVELTRWFTRKAYCPSCRYDIRQN